MEESGMSGRPINEKRYFGLIFTFASFFCGSTNRNSAETVIESGKTQDGTRTIPSGMSGESQHRKVIF
jgi:hypothetical protein